MFYTLTPNLDIHLIIPAIIFRKSQNTLTVKQPPRLTAHSDLPRANLLDVSRVNWAFESGRIAGYAGDVWFPQPAPADHPWRTMPFNGMTPHVSGTSLSAQARYATGTLEILESYFDETPIREEYLIVDSGNLAGTGASSYKLS